MLRVSPTNSLQRPVTYITHSTHFITINYIQGIPPKYPFISLWSCPSTYIDHYLLTVGYTCSNLLVNNQSIISWAFPSSSLWFQFFWDNYHINLFCSVVSTTVFLTCIKWLIVLFVIIYILDLLAILFANNSSLLISTFSDVVWTLSMFFLCMMLYEHCPCLYFV